MTRPIEVLTGIAGSGKTTRLREIYREALFESHRLGRPGTTLWLTPSSASRSGILESLCDGRLPVIFSPNVMTFQDFAERILRGSPHQITPLSAVMQRGVLRQIVNRHLRRNVIPHFAPIAESSGFLDLVADFIAELKRSETWPEDFVEACRRRGARPADRELAEIYREYQTLLLDRGVYDGEGRFWSAAEALKRGHWGPFDTLSLVIVDGFSDFTHTQHRILQQLADHAERVLISLPLEADASRDDLFAKSYAVMENLKRSGEICVSPLDSRLPSEDRLAPAFRHVSRALFSNPRATIQSSTAEGIEVVAAAGQRGEVNWVASRVKELMLRGARPAEIVVAVRELEDYRDLLEERFHSAGIPIVCGAEVRLDQLPICRSLLQVLQCELEDWPFRRLMALLHSSWFRPEWPEARQGNATRCVADLLRRFKLSEGRGRILERLERAANAEDGSGETSEDAARERRTIRQVWALLVRLSTATEGLRRSHDLSGWGETLGGLLTDLGFDRETADEANATTSYPLAAREFRDRLVATLFDAGRAEALFDGRLEVRALSRFFPELKELLEHAEARMTTADSGRVRIVPAEQVRNLDMPNLFVVGLTERSFPRMQGDDCLYSESERRQLNREGLTLAHRHQRAQEEMLMFYSIVTRARRRLVLTYPVVTDEGQPLSPSPYLSALLDLFDPKSLTSRLEEQLDPVPALDQLLSTADARVRGMHELLYKRPQLFRTVGEQAASSGTVANVLAAVDAHVKRFETAGFTNYEGSLENPDNLDWIRRRYSPEHEFSATQLESYADCPFAFFVSHVLGVRPLPSVEVETDFGARGTLVHNVLAELHRQIPGGAGEGSAVLEGVEIATRFQELLSERLKEHTERSALQQALTQIEERLLLEWGGAYGDQWRIYVESQPEGTDRLPVPSHFEASFGQSGTDHAEVESRAPLVVGRGVNEVRIGGRIDRIDVGALAGRTVFTVIDYKTGRQRSGKLEDISAGRALQLALYTLAVIRLEIVGPGAGPLQMGYWHVREKGFTPGISQRRRPDDRIVPLEPAVWDEIAQTLDDAVPRLAKAMRSGKFPIYNDDLNCTGRCPLHTICRVAQIRALHDRLDKNWSW